MTNLLHAVRGDDRGGGLRVDGGAVDGGEAVADCVALFEVGRRRGEVDDGAADDDGAQEQNH